MPSADYAYIVGRIRALETKMLNRNLMERMLDAPSASEAFRVLNDMPLILGAIGDHHVPEFNTVLLKALQSLKRLYKRMTPDLYALRFLWYRYDFHNLKVTLKARLTGRGYEDVKHALIDMGEVPVEQWESFLMDGKLLFKTTGLIRAIQEATRLYEETGNPQIIDQVIDQHYLDILNEVAVNIGSALMQDYLARRIDFANIKTFIRSRELKADESKFTAMLLNGGNLGLDLFRKNYEKGIGELKAALQKKMGADDYVACVEQYMDHGKLSYLEKKVHELQQEFVSQASRIPFGPEPVFAFYFRFENHLLLIRSVLVGKLNNIPLEDIKDTLLTL
jgi:V/A-type H+-transporting ATPase subunit C